jgi:hypothetical protein
MERKPCSWSTCAAITRSDIESDGASSQQRGFLVVKYELAP